MQRMNGDSTFDAYLSYAEADAVWVDDVLLPVLTDAGLRVATEEDARLGAPQLSERERLLLASRHLVPILSPAWLQDRQAVFTQQIAEYIDPAADATRILPVLLQPTPHLPPRLARLEATDCSDPAQWGKALKRLLVALQAKYELPEYLFSQVEKRYRAQVVERYNRLGFAGLGVGDLRLSDVPLDDVFVRLTLTVEKIVREPIAPEELVQEQEERSRNPFRRGEKKEDDRPRERTITVQEPITLGKALAQHALIVGEPGAGKSTLLRWLAVTFAAGRQWEADRLGPQADADRLPLLVELGRLPKAYLQANSRETPNWKAFLPQYLTKQPPFDDIPAAFLEQALAQGRCLLLCDGLDEIADLSARRRLADSLADYARSSANRLVLSSRPAGVSGSEASLGARFRRLTIQRLAPEDVRRFFGLIYAQDLELTPDEAREEADRLYAVVESQPKTLELASTPLLATLLLLLWNRDGYLPERRVELYERCCQMLIESWEAQHDVAYTGVLREIGWERHLRLLAPLAYAIHNTGQRTDAPASELIPVLAQAMQAEGLATSASATLEAEKFLRTLSLRSALRQQFQIWKNVLK